MSGAEFNNFVSLWIFPNLWKIMAVFLAISLWFNFWFEKARQRASPESQALWRKRTRIRKYSAIAMTASLWIMLLWTMI